MSNAGRRWRVELHRDAEKTLHRLPGDLLKQVDEVIQSLERDPRPSPCKRLKGPLSHLYCIRVREWRISYVIEDDKLLVLVMEIAPRSGAYRRR